MSKVQEILRAVRELSHEEYLELRASMDEFDEAEWEAARTQAARDWAATGLTDDDIDEAVRRRRHESRR
ncbi:MAG: hypothetical protein U0746_16745 [Gemmataceae bacterium]